MRLGDLAHAERLDYIGKLSKNRTSILATGGGNSVNTSKLTISVGDYRDVVIPPDSVIVADIPYFQTREYRHNKDAFDHEAFYRFCEEMDQPVFVCEYWCPPERFFCIAEFDRVSTFSATNNSMRVVEKVFLANKWRDWWNEHKKPDPPVQKSLFDDIVAQI